MENLMPNTTISEFVRKGQQPPAGQCRCIRCFRFAAMLAVLIPWCASKGAPPSADDIKNASLKALFDNRKFVLAPSAVYDFCMVAQRADVIVTNIDVELTDNANHPINANILDVRALPGSVKAGEVTCKKVKLDEQWMQNVVSARGTVSAAYLVPGGGTPGVSVWSVEIDRPISDLKVGPSQAVTLQFVRSVPFVPQTDSRCSVYRVAPGGDFLPDKLTLFADLIGSGDTSTVQPHGATVDASAKLDAKKENPRICFSVTFPGEVNALRSTVWIEPPHVSTETPIGARFDIKDHWLWRALAVIVAYSLALALTWIVTHFRTRLLNDSKRSALRSRLNVFLAAHPNFSNDASVVLIDKLLDQSSVQDKEGDFDSSAQSLSSAETRVTALETSPPAQPTPLADGTEAIRVLDPQETQAAGARLTFLVAKPDPSWQPTDTLTWSVDGTVMSSGVDLLSTRFRIATPGRHVVIVTNGTTPVSRTLVIQRRPRRSIVTELKLTDRFPYAVGFLVAIATGYAMTASAESWGTPADYATLLAAAFGLSSGVQGLAPLISQLRR
jgi:hypothetical protein